MKAVCTGFVVLGFILMAASFLWPQLDDGSTTWTDEKAAAYQDVSLQYHNLSFRDLDNEENRRQRDETKAQFEALKSELDGSRDRGNRVATWMWWSGVVLAAVGVVGALTTSES